MKQHIVLGLLSALTVLGSISSANAFTATVAWGSGAGCSGQSPAIRLASVPKGTASLDLKMTDLNMPSFNHGGGSVAFDGKTSFAAGELFGMFSSYRGPCPPPGSTHRYQWTISAKDSSGKVLGTANAVIPFAR
jgi:phosphatidylethanolamine-binding protein (PEBP) family uncharacterized protein